MSRFTILPFASLFICLAGFTPFNSPGSDSSLSVSNACEVLAHFRGEYSYGGLGIASESNDAELALWIIVQSPKAADTLSNIYPQCSESGKAYVLAALYRLDRKAFASLTNSFCSEPGDIITGVGCIEGSLSREELLADIQKKKSVFAFNPSRKPVRLSQLAFFNNTRDVYAERRRWEEEQRQEQERGNALLQSNPRLSAFTNLFRVESATADFGSLEVYFTAKSQWNGNFIPREKLPFEAMAETVFPKDGDVVNVGIAPERVLTELKTLAGLPFVKLLDAEIGVQCVRVRVAGDRLQWDSTEAEKFEQRLRTGVPPKDWTYFILDVGRKEHRMISFYHPRGLDLYVVDEWLFESPNWRKQYRKITGKNPNKLEIGEWGNPDPEYLPVVDNCIVPV